MRYASVVTREDGMYVVTVLPLSAVPQFDPENPPEGTYLVADEVEIGWRYAGGGQFAPPPLPPPPSPAQIQQELTKALDAHIDSVAKAKGYDSRITCTMRAGYVNPWQAECIAFGQWMDQCYVIALGIMAEVAAQTRPVPTTAELLAELPVMVWV